MLKKVSVPLLILCCSCANTQKEEEFKSAIKNEVTQLKSLQEQISKTQVDIKNQMFELTGEIAVIKTKVNQIETKQSEAQTPVSPTETGRKVDAALGRLKANQLSPAETAKEIAAIEMSAPYVFERLKQNIQARDFDTAARIEEVLAYMPINDIKSHLTDALKDDTLRIPAAKIIGRVGSTELSAVLEPYQNNNFPYFRFVVGDSLVRCKNKFGIPILIDALKNDRDVYSIIAFDILQRVTKNSFGYKIYASAVENQKAIELWQDWWHTSENSFHFE